MANLLPAETVAAIRQLAKNGWSNRRVARELKVSRGTIARQLATPDGPDKADTKVSRPGPKSLCSRYEDHVLRMIETGFSARAILAELQEHYNFAGSYPSVLRFVKRLRVNVKVAPSRKNQALTWMGNLLDGKLSPAELASEFDSTNDVETLAKCLRKGSEKDRKKAAVVFARKKGISSRAVAQALELNRDTTSRYYANYLRSGVEGLYAPVARGTRKSEKKVYKEAVIAVLHAPPSTYGINRTTWKQSDLQRVLHEEKGLNVSKRCIRDILKRAGYRWRKARRVLTSTDPNYREKLSQITKTLSGLKSDERFFSVDEFGPFHITKKPGRKLVAPGEEYTIPQRQKSRGRLILTASLELSTNQVTHFYSERKNTGEMIRLLDTLLTNYGNVRTLYLSWDAASWHMSKAFYKRVAWVNARSESGLLPRVEVVPLPACAQFLNVIESVFSGMARAIIHNSDYACTDEAKRAIDAYFAQRNRQFQNHPRRAGNKIWGKERTPPVFSESNVCKDPRYR